MGSKCLINQTNDAWFDPSSQSQQHMAHAIFRCIENNVPMVRACNTGVSCIIDNKGRVRQSLKPLTEGFMIIARIESLILKKGIHVLSLIHI